MSSNNGGHNGQGDEEPPRRNPVVQRAIDDAVREATKRVEERDPLGEGRQGIMPKLLIGLQKSYDPTTWEPDYSLLPKDDPERKAYEAGKPIPLSQSERYKAAHQLLEELDALDDFNAIDD